MKESLKDLLTRALEEKEAELEKTKSEVEAIRTALRSVGISRVYRSTHRGENGGHQILFRGCTTQVLEYLSERDSATPQQMWEAGIKAKDFSSFKSILSSAYRTGKLTRTTNKKGFFEYALPKPSAK